MAGKLTKKRQTRRDAADAATLKHAGDPSHINAREDALLRETMPEAHGRVVTRGLLAEAGRRGDDRVTKLIPAEAALLKARGGSGTVNPASGLLEYSTAGGGGGEGGDNGVGGPGNGSAGTGWGQGPGPGDPGYGGGGIGGNTSFADNYDVGWSGPESEVGYSASQPNWNEYAFNGYKPADTWGRVIQEFFSPSVPTAKYGPTTKTNLGIVGAIGSMLTGQPMGVAMGIGAAMGRASSPATQAANAAAESARSAHNSGGNQGNHNLNEIDARLAERAGTQSGARTADLPPPGYTVNPAGQIVPMPGQGSDRPAWRDPVQNLLADYIWRGRQGSGFGW